MLQLDEIAGMAMKIWPTVAPNRTILGYPLALFSGYFAISWCARDK